MAWKRRWKLHTRYFCVLHTVFNIANLDTKSLHSRFSFFFFFSREIATIHDLYFYNAIISWNKVTTIHLRKTVFLVPSPPVIAIIQESSWPSRLTYLCHLLNAYMQLDLVITRLLSSYWIMNQQAKYITSKI